MQPPAPPAAPPAPAAPAARRHPPPRLLPHRRLPRRRRPRPPHQPPAAPAARAATAPKLPEVKERLAAVGAISQAIAAEVQKVIIGKPHIIDNVLINILPTGTSSSRTTPVWRRR